MLPEALERAVLRLLAKRPEDRYQTAQEFLAALQDVAKGRARPKPAPVPSPPGPPAPRPAAPRRSPNERISFACTCGMTMQARRQFAGERIRCPWCKTFIVVPGTPFRAEPSQEAAPEEEPGEPIGADQEGALEGAISEQPAELRRSAMRAAMWIGISVVASNVFKLATKIIMTRLVLPESYGVLEMAMVWLQGVHMFADVGIETSIIQSKRGDDRDFLNTAWTMQIIRGMVLWAIMLAIAWPVSVFYGEPILLLLIPAIGFSAIIDGLNSTAVSTLRRHLVRAPLVALEFGMTVFGQAVTIAWMVVMMPAWEFCPGVAIQEPPKPMALNDPIIWGFVVGGLSTSLLNMILTHVLLSRERNRFRWDREAVHEMLHFGKWIFLSTMITFLALQAERIIVPKVCGARLNGIYTQALSLAGIATGLMGAFATQLILPVYSRLHLAGEDIRKSFNKVHGSASVFAALLVTGMIAAGPAAVKCQLGDAFQQAGWMLQFVAVSAWFQMLEGTLGATLLTLGQSRSLAMVNATRLIGVAIFVPAGFFIGRHLYPESLMDRVSLGGFIGMLVGFIASDFLRYLMVVWMARKNGMSALGSDITVSLLIALISPAAAFGGQWLAKPLTGYFTNDKMQALMVFLCQGLLVVVAWALVYLLWIRKRHGLRAAMTEAEGLPEAPAQTMVSFRRPVEA
jgi:O-antigen/teichoic acid export membrane protein